MVKATKKQGARGPATDPAEQARALAAAMLQQTGGARTPAEGAQLTDKFLPRLDPADPRTRKRRRILDAGTSLFVKHGYRKTSMDEVARAAHVAKGTLYLYFPTKADLLAAAIADEKVRFAPRMAGMMDPALSGRERLRVFLHQAFTGLQDMPLMLRMLSGDAEVHMALAEVSEHTSRPVLDIQVDVVKNLLAAAVQGEGWSAERLGDAAQVVLGVLYSAAALFDVRVRGHVPVERYARALADLLVDGTGSGVAAPAARRGEQR